MAETMLDLPQARAPHTLSRRDGTAAVDGPSPLRAAVECSC